MTLIKCPECGKEFSDKARACPNCACPIKKRRKKTKKKNLIENIVFCIICLLILTITCHFIILKSPKYITIPDITNYTKEEAIDTLEKLSLRPSIIEKYDKDIEKGKIISTSPKAGQNVTENDIINIYISKGLAYIESVDSTIYWYSISNIKEDDWEFTSPYIQEGYLYIECQPKFSIEFDWNENDFGYASTTQSFTKKIPIELNYQNKHVNINERQNIVIKISMEDLKDELPNKIFFNLNINIQNKKDVINLNFNINWNN